MSVVEQSTETITGSEILVEMLIRQGAEHCFAYPGGASMPLHQALRKNRDRIRTILDRDVRPYVEQDGGEISFAGYRDGIVEVVLQGACAGCPSSSITLKMGIEARLKEEIPEIKSVVAL